MDEHIKGVLLQQKCGGRGHGLLRIANGSDKKPHRQQKPVYLGQIPDEGSEGGQEPANTGGKQKLRNRDQRNVERGGGQAATQNKYRRHKYPEAEEFGHKTGYRQVHRKDLNREKQFFDEVAMFRKNTGGAPRRLAESQPGQHPTQQIKGETRGAGIARQSRAQHQTKDEEIGDHQQ